MSSPDSSLCIGSNPDISGIGVRAAIYAQNILSFAPAFFALRNKTVTVAELEALETQSTTILITAFAILISVTIQAVSHGATNFHAAIILNLSWMNNTNLFIYLLLYVYHKAEMVQKEPTWPQYTAVFTRAQIANVKVAAKNPVFVIGSFHLSLMAIVGIWLWSRPASFGDSAPCSLSASVVILNRGVELRSPGLRIWSILVYSVLLTPGLNLAAPIAFFSLPYVILKHVPSTSLRRRARILSVVTGLIVLAAINVIFVAGTEATLRKNTALLGNGDTKWTFGQILALLLLLVPIRDLGETLWGRRPKRLGKKLLDAAGKGNLEAAKSFLELGADTNIKDNNGCNALHLVAEKGYTDIARSLVENHANVNAKDGLDRSALLMAVVKGHTDTAKCLVEHGADVNAKYRLSQSTLLVAAERGHKDTARCLVEHGADVNAKDDLDRTALLVAAVEGHTDLAKYLIEHGADVDFKRNLKETVLSLAAENGHTDLAKYLVEHGANLNEKDEEDRTPLHMAAEKGHTDLAKCLVEQGADMNAKDEEDRTALLVAAEKGHTDLAKCLVEHGVNVNAKNYLGKTALHMAAENGYTDLAKYLVEHGANVNAKNNWDRTALLEAAENGHMDTVKYLIEHGANINAMDRGGQTALRASLTNDHVAVANFLYEYGSTNV